MEKWEENGTEAYSGFHRQLLADMITKQLGYDYQPFPPLMG